jgi:hypothetical protein
MTMKITKTLMAVSILAAAANVHAATYNVTGQLLGVNTMEATSDPTLYVHTGTTAYSTAASTWPTFTGVWNLNTSGNTGTVSGIFADFVQYSTSINVGIFGTAVVNQPHLVYSFQNGTVAYDAASRTLTVGQAMTYSDLPDKNNGPAIAVLNAQTSDGTLLFDRAHGALDGVCTVATGTVCSGQALQFIPKPDLERFYMTLTFSSDFSSFTGTAVGADVGGTLPAGKTGNTWVNWSFSGTLVPSEPPTPTVPVPAAAWMLGSGLVGLAGVARRRRNQA